MVVEQEVALGCFDVFQPVSADDLPRSPSPALAMIWSKEAPASIMLVSVCISARASLRELLKED